MTFKKYYREGAVRLLRKDKHLTAGTWFCDDGPVVSCPKCALPHLVNEYDLTIPDEEPFFELDEDGNLYPDFVCLNRRCNYMGRVKLDRYEPPTEITFELLEDEDDVQDYEGEGLSENGDG